MILSNGEYCGVHGYRPWLKDVDIPVRPEMCPYGDHDSTMSWKTRKGYWETWCQKCGANLDTFPPSYPAHA